nr:PREDICTED: uncharacterized protein C7orf57 homolog isoform X7 [Anolis carolinensis]|eukprot:XP_008111131.1 PREDICTED: uncharacterized protein C7orf57 homolog isoform X7 [Anolis carolinensis]
MLLNHVFGVLFGSPILASMMYFSRDLLRHFTSTPRKMSLGSYGAPEWYSHHNKSAAPDESKSRLSTIPDYMIHEEFKTDQPTSYEPKRGPFDFDMKSVWQRDAEDKENKEKKEENEVQMESSPGSTKEEIKLPAITPRYPHRTPQPIATKEFHGGNRLYFPPMPLYKKNEPVNFSKLMSSGYGDDWLQQRDEWEKKNSQPNVPVTPDHADWGQWKMESSKFILNSEPSQPESTQTDNETS